MTELVGNSAAYTVETNTFNTDDLAYFTSGFVASATGTATDCFLRIADTAGWGSATAAKIQVHNSSGTLLATATFSSAQGAGWISSALDSSIGITSGNTYYLAIICTGSNLAVRNSGNTFECKHVTGGTYASPPTTLTPGSDPGSPKANFNVYLDGTVSSSGNPHYYYAQQ